MSGNIGIFEALYSTSHGMGGDAIPGRYTTNFHSHEMDIKYSVKDISDLSYLCSPIVVTEYCGNMKG